MRGFVDYYAVLQVHPKADSDVVAKAYRVLMLKHHPDQGGDPDIARQLNEAFEVLSDPHKRAAYNLDWAASQSQRIPAPEARGPYVRVDERAGGTSRTGGWSVAARITLGVTAVLAIFYYPFAPGSDGLSTVVSVALNPVAWAAAGCAGVAQYRSRRHSIEFTVVILLLVIVTCMGAIIAELT